MNQFELSYGSLASLMQQGEKCRPILQVLCVKRIVDGHYHMIVSDGCHAMPYVLFESQEKSISVYSIVQLNSYVIQIIHNEKIKIDKKGLVILKLDVLQDGSEIGQIIGSPIKLIVDIIPSAENADTLIDDNSDYIPSAKRLATVDTIQSNKTEARICTIADLNLNKTRWTLKVKVTNKTELIQNSNAEGNLFSVDLLDDSGQIKCTAFTEMARKYHEFIKKDKMYYISDCQIKIANKQSPNLNNDYELIIIEESVIEECNDIENVATTSEYQFVSLHRVKNMAVGNLADIIGVCTRASELQEDIIKNTEITSKKREVYLVDQSNYEICLCLLGNDAVNFTLAEDNPIVAIKDAKIRKFLDNKHITTTKWGIKLNPDIPQTFALRAWYNTRDANVSVLSTTREVFIKLELEDSEIEEIIDNPIKSVTGIKTTVANNDNIPPAKPPATFSPIQVNRTVLKSFPIADLNLYTTRWPLKVKVTNKTDLKKWSNARGCLFSVDLLDDSGQIKCTAFTEMALKYHEFIQVDKIYYISDCQIKRANTKFSHLNNDYELIILNKSLIEECIDIENVSSVSLYKFLALRKIKYKTPGNLVDVIGVCTRVSDVQKLVKRNHETEVNKREIYLLDQSNYETCLSLWEKEAADFTSALDNPIVVVRDAKVCEYLGHKFISTTGSAIRVNPDIPEANVLRTWYNTRDANVSVHSNTSINKDEDYSD